MRNALDKRCCPSQRPYSSALVQPEASGDGQPTHRNPIFFGIGASALRWFGDEPLDRLICIFYRIFIPDSSRELR